LRSCFADHVAAVSTSSLFSSLDDFRERWHRYCTLYSKLSFIESRLACRSTVPVLTSSWYFLLNTMRYRSVCLFRPHLQRLLHRKSKRTVNNKRSSAAIPS
jgi:hypothetical protein